MSEDKTTNFGVFNIGYLAYKKDKTNTLSVCVSSSRSAKRDPWLISGLLDLHPLCISSYILRYHCFLDELSRCDTKYRHADNASAAPSRMPVLESFSGIQINSSILPTYPNNTPGADCDSSRRIMTAAKRLDSTLSEDNHSNARVVSNSRVIRMESMYTDEIRGKA